MASFLLASVRSTAGRRNDPPRRVPTARSSYAAQASYIAVCTMARARATIGGPSFATRIAWSAALSHRIATLSEVAATSWRAAAPPLSGYGDTASRAQLVAPRTTPATSQPVLNVILGMALSLAIGPPRRGPVGLAHQPVSPAAKCVLQSGSGSRSATPTSMDRDLPRRQRLPGEIVVAISGRHIPGYAVEHPQDRELQRGDPRATGRDGNDKRDIAEDRLHTRAERGQHLHGGCATEAAPVRRPARYWPLHGHQAQSEEVRVAGHETREVSLRRSVTCDHCREAEVRPVDVSIAVEIGAEGRAAAARNLDCMRRRRSRAVARYGGPPSEGISRSATRGEPERRCHYCGVVQRVLHGFSLALTGVGCATPVPWMCALIDHVERRPVGVSRRSRWCFAVPVVHETLRRSDAFEHGVRGSHYMAADGECPLAAVRVGDLDHEQPGADVSFVADVVMRQRKCAWSQSETHEAGHCVGAASSRPATGIESLPCPTTRYVL